MAAREPTYCPRCGAQWKPETEETDGTTTVNEVGEVVPDDEGLALPLFFPESDGWAELSDGVFVCPACATQVETWRSQQRCIRCGKAQDDDYKAVEDGEWLNPENPGSFEVTVCGGCTTDLERRRSILDFLELILAAAEQRRGEGQPSSNVPDLDVFEAPIQQMLQRAVPNKLHYLQPLDPTDGEPEPWDRMPEALREDIVRCQRLGARVHAADASTAAAAVRLRQRYEELAEQTIRAYAVELRRQRHEASSGGKA